jgi:DNA-binding MarR family transcriptional regulator
MNDALRASERAALKEVATDCLCRKARNAARVLTRFYDRFFDESEIEPTQFTLLVALRLTEPISLLRLADILGLERTTLTRNLNLLQRDGHVEINQGKDARQHLISLTDNGRRALSKALPQWQRAHRAARAALGKGNFDRLSLALTLTDQLNEK